MAKKVIWSPLAQEKRKEILGFWIENNQSNTYSIKLDQLFKKALKLISQFPNLGRPTDILNVRVKIVRDYLIFYQEVDVSIEVITIWNSRQDPKQLEKELQSGQID